jgi:hypothetical protein
MECYRRAMNRRADPRGPADNLSLAVDGKIHAIEAAALGLLISRARRAAAPLGGDRLNEAQAR